MDAETNNKSRQQTMRLRRRDRDVKGVKGRGVNFTTGRKLAICCPAEFSFDSDHSALCCG